MVNYFHLHCLPAFAEAKHHHLTGFHLSSLPMGFGVLLLFLDEKRITRSERGGKPMISCSGGCSPKNRWPCLGEDGIFLTATSAFFLTRFSINCISWESISRWSYSSAGTTCIFFPTL